MTALHWASSYGHAEIVQLLLQYNGDPNICNKVSVSVYRYCCMYYNV